MEEEIFTLKDDFMFKTVMSDEKRLKELIHRILPEIEMEDLNVVIKERDIDLEPDGHGIRLDIYASDGKRLYDIEMQVSQNQEDLLRRSRYYHSMMDIDHLQKGEGYRDLKDSYVIFICDFDPFDAKMYKYTMKKKCMEYAGNIEDGVTTIFLNTKGEKGNISKELQDFLVLVGEGTVSYEDNYLIEIEKEVKKINKSSRWRDEKMSMRLALEDARYHGKQEGIKEGIEKGIKEGIKEGKKEGTLETRKEDILIFFNYLNNNNVSKEEIYKIISEQFNLDISEVKEIIKNSNE